MKILADYKEVDYVLWSNFVFSHPKGNIFQTPDIVKVYELTRNYSPIVIIATEKTDIAGVLVGVIQKEYKGLPGYLSSRCILTGGPLARNDDAVIIEALLLAYKSRVRSRVIYSQFRNIFSPEGYMNVFSKAGFSYDPHLDIHINLKQAHPEYWNSLKSKLRQNIRKAEKNNVTFA